MRKRNISKRIKAVLTLVCCLGSMITLTGCDVAIDMSTASDIETWATNNSTKVQVLRQMNIINDAQKELLDDYFNIENIKKQFGLESSSDTGQLSVNIGEHISHVYEDFDSYINASGDVKPYGSGSSSDLLAQLKTKAGTDGAEQLTVNNGIKIYTVDMNKVNTSKNVNNSGIDQISEAIYNIQVLQQNKNPFNDNKTIGDTGERDDLIEGIIGGNFSESGRSLGGDAVNLDLLIASTTNGTKTYIPGSHKDVVIKGTVGDSDTPVPICDVRVYDINDDYYSLVTGSGGVSNFSKYYLVGDKALLVSYPVSYIAGIKNVGGDKYEVITQDAGILMNLASGSIEKYSVDGNNIKNAIKPTSDSSQNDIYLSSMSQINYLLGNDIYNQQNVITETETKASWSNSIEGSDGNSVYEESSIKWTKEGQSDNNYQMAGSKVLSSTGNSNSSFCIVGSNTKTYTYTDEIELSSGTVTCNFDADVPEVVLKDYLEITPTPSYSSGNYGEWTPLGRRIRFTTDVIQNGGAQRDMWAMYIDNSGSNMFPGFDGSTTTIPITLDDICANISTTRTITKVGESASEKVAEESSTDSSNTYQKMIGLSNPTVIYNTQIATTLLFEDTEYWHDLDSQADGSIPNIPTENNKQGKDRDTIFKTSDESSELTNTKQPLYGIKISKDIYDTSLYSTWLNSTDTHNSTDWWNGWLKGNGFSFQVDKNQLLQGSAQALSYEREKKENIKLDMNVIERLQNDIDVENGNKIASTIRTIFTVLGIILLFYGLLIPCAWLFDTNIVMGPKILTIATFGKWVAVPEKDDIAEAFNHADADKQKYVDLKDAIIAAIVVIALGILFTSFDIVKLIAVVVKWCTTGVKWVANLIFR